VNHNDRFSLDPVMTDASCDEIGLATLPHDALVTVALALAAIAADDADGDTIVGDSLLALARTCKALHRACVDPVVLVTHAVAVIAARPYDHGLSSVPDLLISSPRWARGSPDRLGRVCDLIEDTGGRAALRVAATEDAIMGDPAGLGRRLAQAHAGALTRDVTELMRVALVTRGDLDLVADVVGLERGEDLEVDTHGLVRLVGCAGEARLEVLAGAERRSRELESICDAIAGSIMSSRAPGVRDAALGMCDALRSAFVPDSYSFMNPVDDFFASGVAAIAGVVRRVCEATGAPMPCDAFARDVTARVEGGGGDAAGPPPAAAVDSWAMWLGARDGKCHARVPFAKVLGYLGRENALATIAAYMQRGDPPPPPPTFSAKNVCANLMDWALAFPVDDRALWDAVSPILALPGMPLTHGMDRITRVRFGLCRPPIVDSNDPRWRHICALAGVPPEPEPDAVIPVEVEVDEEAWA
jgi:hypothetical protein